jgi:hypothetical protein
MCRRCHGLPLIRHVSNRLHCARRAKYKRAARRQLKRFSGYGISSPSRAALNYFERAETYYVDASTTEQLLSHDRKHQIDNATGFLI